MSYGVRELDGCLSGNDILISQSFIYRYKNVRTE